MKVYYDCAPCYLRQAKEAIDLSTDDENLKMELMEDIFKFLSENYHPDAPSNKTGSIIRKMIKEKTKCNDPYLKEKIESNKLALKYFPIAKDLLNDNTLENCVKIAILGNLLDFGAFKLDTNIEKLIKNGLKSKLAINHVNLLEKDLKNHKNLLYLLDNVGEVVFDKILLEKIKEYDINITLAVKEEPIINDACLEDALEADLDKYGEIVSIGTDTVGFVYSEISKEFKRVFDNADFIISKGLGNYEGLTEIDLSTKDVYFLLCVKCLPIAKDLNLDLEDMVILKN